MLLIRPYVECAKRLAIWRGDEKLFEVWNAELGGTRDVGTGVGRETPRVY